MNTEAMSDPQAKPIIVGPYLRIWNEYPRFSYWNGLFFGLLVDTPERAEEYKDSASTEQDLPWAAI